MTCPLPFGHSPKTNKDGGRDHWPRISCALLAGGMRTGQVIGAINRFGEESAEHPIHFRGVFAALYHNLGIDLKTIPGMDTLNRPNDLFLTTTPSRNWSDIAFTL